jgi:hypothetical protein
MARLVAEILASAIRQSIGGQCRGVSAARADRVLEELGQ